MEMFHLYIIIIIINIIGQLFIFDGTFHFTSLRKVDTVV